MTESVASEQPPVSSLTAFEVCNRAVEKWKAVHCPQGDFERETMMITARVPSWISATSVVAGVTDVLSAARPESGPLSVEVIHVLANDLAGRLLKEGMLIAQPKRSGRLG